MIRYTIKSACLVFTADNEGRADLARAFREGGYDRAESEVLDKVQGNGLEMVAPEKLGALTDSPIFCHDVSWTEDGEAILAVDAVFWFPNYMIRDPWRELANKGRVEFPRE